MEWLRGGHWEPDRGSAFLTPRIAASSLHSRPYVRLIGTGRTDWLALARTTNNLVTYSVTPLIAQGILNQAADFSAKFGDVLRGFGSLTQRADRDAALCKMLGDFGPLDWSDGVMGRRPTLTYSTPGPEPDSFGWQEPGSLTEGMELETMHRDLRDLAGARELAAQYGGKRTPIVVQKQMLIASSSGRAELEPVPEWSSDGLRWDVRPLTLKAYLWRAVLRLMGNGLTIATCKYCGAAFEQLNSSGRRRTYCNEHSGSTFRVKVSRGQAPSASAPGKLDTT